MPIRISAPIQNLYRRITDYIPLTIKHLLLSKTNFETGISYQLAECRSYTSGFGNASQQQLLPYGKNFDITYNIHTNSLHENVITVYFPNRTYVYNENW